MPNKYFESLKKYFYFICNGICKIVSIAYFPIVFSALSIAFVLLRICAQFIDSLSFLKMPLDFVVYIVLIFSIFGLFYQTQRFEIIIYPPKIRLVDLEGYYGVRDMNHEKEREIEILFSKEGVLKLILHSITIDYPEVGELRLLKTSFYSKDGGNTRAFEEMVQRGYEKIYDQEVEGFGGFIYCFRIPDKEKYFPETTHKITAKFCYRILGFDLFKEKSVKIN